MILLYYEGGEWLVSRTQYVRTPWGEMPDQIDEPLGDGLPGADRETAAAECVRLYGSPDDVEGGPEDEDEGEDR